MTRTALPLSFSMGRILQLFYRPRSVFNWIASEGGRLWIFPLLLLTVVTLLRILVGGWLEVQRASQGEILLPPDWPYYTPEMQAQYIQAAEATKSPVFVYVLPIIVDLTAIWLGWIIISSLLHLAFTLVGGRGTNVSTSNLVAWAGLPFTLRELLRIIYLLIVQHPIMRAGLSGFVSQTGSNGLLFISALLSLTDIFLIWHIVLLIIGARQIETVSNVKSLAVILFLISLSLALQAGTSVLGSQLGGMVVTRPFYF